MLVRWRKPPGPQRFCRYLWGDRGRLHALFHAMGSSGRRASSGFPLREPPDIYTVDDVESWEIFSRNFLNYADVRSHSRRRPGQYRLITAEIPPPMKGRPTISRLSWGLVLQVHPLTDVQKDAALRKLKRREPD